MSPLQSAAADSHYDRDALHPPREPGIGRLSHIPVEECGEPLVDLSERCPQLDFATPIPWVRESVAEMLRQATELLPRPHIFLIGTGYRTLEIQRAGYQAHLRQLAERHPEWPRNILVREANRFFHPPDAKAPPGHTTGGAIDITIAGPDGTPLDLSTPKDGHSNTDGTFYRGLTDEARKNRALLYDILSAVGFSNCTDEWWHWSYGDSGWAYRLGNPKAIYGMVTDLPPRLAQLVAEVGVPEDGILTRKGDLRIRGQWRFSPEQLSLLEGLRKG